MNSIWAQLIINVLAGAVAGGVTNQVAVWMLFHPHKKRFGIQGAIPKNKALLAKSFGRTVGERLLTPGDMVDELTRAGVRDAFDQKVALFISNMLETERSSLTEMLPPHTIDALRSALEELADSVAGQLETYFDSDDFHERVRAFVVRARAELSKQAVGELLSPEQRDALSLRASKWAEELSRSAELEVGVREYIARHADRLIASNEPMVSRIPPSVLRSIEGAIESYLPLAAAKLGTFLSHPASRDRIREALHSLFRRLVKDLEFHQRIIARLMITEKTFDKALDALERDGVEQLAALLDDSVVRVELTKTLREAVLSFLSKPVSEIVGDAGGERAHSLVQSAGDYLLRVMRDERTHGFLAAKIREVVEKAEDKSVGDMVSGLSDDSVVRWISAGARSDKAQQLLRDGFRSAFKRALSVKIGRPARWLPADASTRLASTVAPALWDWLQLQLPQLVQQLDVEAIVERKVQGFSIERMEEIIRGVTQRELQLIVQLGYVLGAVIGLITFGVSVALPR